MADNMQQGLWPRGNTLYNGGTINSAQVPTDPTIEGIQCAFKDILWNTVNQPVRTHNMVICQVVRSNATFGLLGKYLARWRAGYFGRQVDGYAYETPAQGVGKPVAVDEFITLSGGVPQYDCFWVVVRGPSLVVTSLGADATNVIVEHQNLMALTAVSSGATTAGRVQPLAAGTTAPVEYVLGAIGRALSAKTTGNTNTDVLVFIGNLA